MKNRINSAITALIRSFNVYTDVIVGAVLMLGSAYFFWAAGSIRIAKQSISMLDNARFMPRLTFGAIAVMGLCIMVKGVVDAALKKTADPDSDKMDQAVTAFKRAVIALVSIAAFIFLMTRIGFIPSAVLYMLFNMFFLSVKEGWKPAAYIVVSLAVAFLAYFLFKKYLFVRLPLGILEGVFR